MTPTTSVIAARLIDADAPSDMMHDEWINALVRFWRLADEISRRGLGRASWIWCVDTPVGAARTRKVMLDFHSEPTPIVLWGGAGVIAANMSMAMLLGDVEENDSPRE